MISARSGMISLSQMINMMGMAWRGGTAGKIRKTIQSPAKSRRLGLPGMMFESNNEKAAG